jgi:hypothetical protein
LFFFLENYLNRFTPIIHMGLGRVTLGRLMYLLKRLQNVRSRIDRLKNKETQLFESLCQLIGTESLRESKIKVPISREFAEIFHLKDNLRHSLMAMLELTEATASHVAERTGRTRGMECLYLNELVSLGYLSKKKIKRKTYFVLKIKKPQKKLFISDF